MVRIYVYLYKQLGFRVVSSSSLIRIDITDSAIAWIEQQANELGLEYKLVRFSEAKPEFSVILTWPGEDPTLSSLLLYSHIDVVAVDPVNWHGEISNRALRNGISH